MRNIANLTRYFPKKFVVIAAMALGLILPGAVFAGWAPSRPVFDWNDPTDRKGSMDGVVFNSFVNTPVYGDERAFFTANSVSDVKDKGQHAVNVKPGDEYILQAYVHNNANESTNDSGKGQATGTRVRFDLPEGKATHLRAIGYIKTDASKVASGFPSMVSDTIDFRSSQPFAIDYVEKSAKFYNNRGVHPLPDDIVDEYGGNIGTKIGFTTMNGEIPGCFEFDGWAVVKVRIVAPELEVSKQVKIEGASTWKETVDAKPGDEVAWLIGIDNKGSDQAVDVTVHDKLPANLKVKPGSVKVFNSKNPSGKVIGDGDIFGSKRANIGEINAGANAFVRFTTIVQSDFETCAVERTNVAAINSDNTGEETDNAKVRIGKPDCAEVTEEKEFTCKILTASPADGDAPLKVTLRASAEVVDSGVTISEYRFDFDNNGTVDRVIKSSQPSVETEHTYTKDATSSVQILTSEGLTTEVKRCQVNIDVAQDVTPPEEDVPSSLPQTGPAETAFAVFGSGVLGHSVRAWFLSRKALKSALLK